MYTIKSKIKFQDKEFEQILHITEHFVIMDINRKRHIFIPDNSIFFIDKINRKLRKPDLSLQLQQVEKLKTMLGRVFIENMGASSEIFDYPSKRVKTYNKNEFINILTVSDIITIPGIENTAYPAYVKEEQAKQITKLELNANELVACTSSGISVNGNVIQRQSMEMVNIETGLENKEEFYKYLAFSYE